MTSAGQGQTARMAAPPEDEASIVREGLKEEYELEKELGRGGMAIVFKARDKQLEREVAIKVLPFSLSFDAEFVERFQREARTAGKLEHPNIIPIYRVGRSGRVIYFVMKYIRGKSLSQVIEVRGALPVPELKRLLREATSALGYAHKHGIVHRDIKPDNIMFDELGQAIVTDFGIAKASSGAKLTGTGMSIGTPHYMSPEQARAQNLDGRSDIYSLGVVAYQSLTGHVPFDGEDSFSIGYKHIMEELPVPQLETQDQREMFGVIQRMMAKKPDDRYQNAEELVAALDGGAVGAPSADMSTLPTKAIEPMKAPTAKGAAPPIASQATTPLPRASASMGKPKDVDTAPAPKPRPAPRPAREKTGSKVPLVLAAVLGLAVVGTGGYYFGVLRPQQQRAAAEAAAREANARLRRLELATAPAAQARVGEALPTPPVVVVRDGNGNAVRGDTVRATVPHDSVQVTNGLAVTDSTGRAVFTGLTLAGPAGSYVIQLQSDTATLRTQPVVLAAAAASRPQPQPAPRDSGTVSIAFTGTSPRNPTVSLNGRPQRGLRFKAPVGLHNLRVEAAGFEAYSNRVTVARNQTVSLTVPPMRAAAVRDTPTTRTTTASVNCSAPQVSLQNPNRACWDSRPVPRVAPQLPRPATCPANTTRAVVRVFVSATGEVTGSAAIAERSNCDAFNASAQAFALDLTFTPAQKNGAAVAAWLQVPIRPAAN